MIHEPKLDKTCISALWISNSSAKLFIISDEKMQKEAFYYIDQDSRNQDSFFERIIRKVPLQSLIILLGPDQTKDEFLQKIESERPLLCQRVVACEFLETDSEIAIANFAYKYLNVSIKNGKIPP